jgi:hypothetical protein
MLRRETNLAGTGALSAIGLTGIPEREIWHRAKNREDNGDLMRKITIIALHHKHAEG